MVWGIEACSTAVPGKEGLVGLDGAGGKLAISGGPRFLPPASFEAFWVPAFVRLGPRKARDAVDLEVRRNGKAH